MARNIANPIGELSGSVNGQTFARNKSGTIVRQKFSPCNPNTLKQAKNRTRFSQRNGAWHTLSDSQKNAWNTYGKQRNNTGLNEFIALNSNISQYLNTVYIGGENFWRLNGGGLTWGVLVAFYLVKTPPKQPINNSVNNSNNNIKKATLTQISTGTRAYFLRLDFNKTLDNNLAGTTRFVFRNNANVSASLMMYYREVKAQNSESRNDKDFEILLSFVGYSRGTVSSVNLDYFVRNMVRLNFNNAIQSKINFGQMYELQFRIIYQDGQVQVLNNQFMSFF